MWFGLTPPENNIVAVGARTILDLRGSKPYIDFVPDRGQATEAPEEERKELLDWLNNVGLKYLYSVVDQFDPSRAKLFTFEDGPFIINANTNGSYGYLYLCAAKRKGDFPPCNPKLFTNVTQEELNILLPKGYHIKKVRGEDVYEILAIGIPRSSWIYDSTSAGLPEEDVKILKNVENLCAFRLWNGKKLCKAWK